MTLDAGDRYEVLGIEPSELALDVTWGDGHTSRFPSIWLLHACRCEACGSTESAVRHVKLTDQPSRPRILSASVSGPDVVVEWGGGHATRLARTWLRAHCLSDVERTRRWPAPRIWGREIADQLPCMTYAEVAVDTDRHLAFLETIRDLGFVVLSGVPVERERTEAIAALVGQLRMTNYGIYELEAKPDPEIVGDMAVALELHTDEPYRVDPPAITLFHVLEQSPEGGDSTLADGLRIAEVLRERDPDAFEILCGTPARFHRTLREGRAFEIHAPVISRDGKGRVTGVRLLDRGMGPVDAPSEQVEPFYDALRSFLTLIYEGEGRIRVRLESGDMLVFNNQRIMHGRTAFDASRARRHVRSCHVDLDEFHSTLRMAYRARGSEQAWMRLGSGVRS